MTNPGKSQSPATATRALRRRGSSATIIVLEMPAAEARKSPATRPCRLKGAESESAHWSARCMAAVSLRASQKPLTISW
jgi:hypothetical protein